MSMAANTTLLHIHQRLKEIFNTPNSVLQLLVIYINYHLYVEELCSSIIKMILSSYVTHGVIERTEIMRQKDHQPLTELLNKFSGTGTQKQISIAFNKDQFHHPHDALHIWAENEPVNEYNVRGQPFHFSEEGGLILKKNYPAREYVGKKFLHKTIVPKKIHACTVG